MVILIRGFNALAGVDMRRHVEDRLKKKNLYISKTNRLFGGGCLDIRASFQRWRSLSHDTWPLSLVLFLFFPGIFRLYEHIFRLSWPLFPHTPRPLPRTCFLSKIVVNNKTIVSIILLAR